MAVEIANFVHAVAILRRATTGDAWGFKFNSGFKPTVVIPGAGQLTLELELPLGNPDAPDDVWDGQGFANIPNLGAGWANVAIDSALVGVTTRNTSGVLTDVLTLHVIVFRMPLT
jgi:hypothetical protein